MSVKDCLIEVQSAVEGLLKPDEARNLLNKIKNKIDESKIKKELDLSEERIIKDIIDEEKKIKLIKKLNAFKDRQKAFDIFYNSLEHYLNKPEESIKAILGGITSSKKGSRLSVDNYQLMFKNKYQGGFQNDIYQLGLADLANRKEIELPIFKEMFDNPFLRGDEGAIDAPISGNKEAYQIAKIAKKYNDIVVDDKNSEGAYISKLPGYVVRQSWLTEKFLKAAGENVKDEKVHKAEWISYFKQRLDYEKTFNGEDANKFLSSAWENIISGFHITTLDASSQYGSKNIANRSSAERVFHFKDGKSFYEAYQKFGHGNFMESLLLGFERAGQDMGLMHVLGTNPRNTLDNVITLLRNHYGGTIAKDLNFKKFENLYKELDGSINAGSSNWQSKIGSAIGVMQETGKLGGITPTSFFGDIPNIISETVGNQKMNLLQPIESIFKELTRVNSKEKLREIMGPFNLFASNFITSLTQHENIREEMTGLLSTYRANFYKYTGFTGLMQKFKSATLLAMQNHYGDLAKKLDWNGLDPQTKINLGLYKIDEGIWNIMRKTSLKEFDGYNLLTVDNIKEITTEDALAYLKKSKPESKKFSAEQINEFKQEVQSKWRIFLYDRTHHGVLEPGARERSILNQGFEKGTTSGLLLRLMTKFKSYGVTVYTRQLERIVKGSGENIQYSQVIPALIAYSILGTVFGYAGLSAIDMLSGKKPRDPRDPRTALASLAKGGGGSIYVDLIYSEISRSNGGAASTILGPAYADAEGLFGVLSNIGKGKMDVAGMKAYKLFEANTPLDVWFLRPAYNYLMGYQIKEMIDPGYFSRLQGYTKKNTGQEFWLKP